MSTVEEIERAIVQLPPEDYQRLLTWWEERVAEDIDRELESAIADGQFDIIATKAVADFHAGLTKPL